MKRVPPKTREKRRRKVHFIPELVTVHPFPATLWFKALFLPCVLHRLNSLLLAEQLRVRTIGDFGIGSKAVLISKWQLIQLQENKVEEGESMVGADVEKPSFGQLPTSSVEPITDTEKPVFGQLLANVSFHMNKYPKLQKEDVRLEDYSGPALDLILSAVTTKNSTDIIDLERLEVIGDAFLKYASSEYMYETYPTYNEGKLTSCKMKQIGNKKLVSMAKDRKLTGMIVAGRFEPKVNFLAPNFSFPAAAEKAFCKSGIPEKYWNAFGLLPNPSFQNAAEHVTECKNAYDKFLATSDRMKDSSGDHVEAYSDIEAAFKEFVKFQLLMTQQINDKTVADSVEALIGAFLVSGGREAALYFMSWLGLRVLRDTRKEDLLNGLLPVEVPICNRFKPFGPPKSPLFKQDAESVQKLKELASGLDAIEETLGYVFRDKAYLVQCVTHPTFTGNRITDCYERLEFLGDAILDYLVTRYLYNSPNHYSPGYITDVRSSLVNNSLLAEIAVKYGFNKHLKYYSHDLFGIVSRYLNKLLYLKMSDAEKASQLEEEECGALEEVQVPKVLADIIEALIGAVYLDSNRNLEQVWKVIYKLMGHEIVTFENDPPKDCVRLLIEAEPTTNLKEKTEELGRRKFRVTVKCRENLYRGIGTNKKLALKAACKRAYQAIKDDKWKYSLGEMTF